MLKKIKMEEIMSLQVIDRFLDNEMNQEEINHFNEYRKNDQSFDQLVVSHIIFRSKIQNFADTTAIKSTILAANNNYQQQNEPVLNKQAKLINIFKKYKRPLSFAAALGLVITLATGGVFKSLNSQEELIGETQKETKNTKKDIERINNKLSNIEKQIEKGNILGISEIAEENVFQGNSNGTGFLLNSDGFVATNYHVISDVKELRLENKKGIQFKASVVYKDKDLDLAILKIEDEHYEIPQILPYSLSKSEPELAEAVFTMGYPREEIVYSEGYVSATLGFNGYKNDCQMFINANPGNSGGPIITRTGKVIGMIKTREQENKSNVFALKSIHILNAIDSVKKIETYKSLSFKTKTTVNSSNKVSQVKSIGNFIYNIRVIK